MRKNYKKKSMKIEKNMGKNLEKRKMIITRLHPPAAMGLLLTKKRKSQKA